MGKTVIKKQGPGKDKSAEPNNINQPQPEVEAPVEEIPAQNNTNQTKPRTSVADAKELTDEVAAKELIEKSSEDLNFDKFNEAFADTFAITLPYEGYKCRAYRGKGEKFYTIACGNLYHPINSPYKGRKVRAGDRVPNTPEAKKLYFKSAYDGLYTHISENLNIEKMNHDQIVGICDMLYNRGPGCLTRNDSTLSHALNDYLSEPSVANGILPSLYMTAKRDGENGMSGLNKRRDHERKLIFGEHADKIIEATDAIKKTIAWKKLKENDLRTIVNLVAECGPDCLTGENVGLPKVINQYIKNPSASNKKMFIEEVEHAHNMKYIQRPSNESIKPEIPDLKDLMNQNNIIRDATMRAQDSNIAMQEAIEQKQNEAKEKSSKESAEMDKENKKEVDALKSSYIQHDKQPLSIAQLKQRER